MILISKRGNLVGRTPDKENTIDYIKNALGHNVYVEVDVRTKDDELYLGHDNPQEKIEENWLENPKFFVHCKDKSTYDRLKLNKNIKCFMQDDANMVTLIDNSDLYWTNAAFHPATKIPSINFDKMIVHESYKGPKHQFYGIYGDNVLKGQLSFKTATDPALRKDIHYVHFVAYNAFLEVKSDISQDDALQKMIRMIKAEI